jgi:hypothetical protein
MTKINTLVLILVFMVSLAANSPLLGQRRPPEN